MKSLLYPGRNSIRIKLSLGALLIAGPLLALLYYYNFYAVGLVRQQDRVSSSAKKT
ncbi:hypothetical protein [Paenibacillus albus]|uniref:hypothetical protein n=1 Tax=Paenibacillus albus TaxID=2495582 RepID=UPI0013E082A2|nr:hypothetical protein [Paenibacillus albus]